MFIRKWGPVYDREAEGGVDDGSTRDRIIPTPPPVPREGPGSGRSKLRAELEQNMRESNEGAVEREEREEPAPKPKKKAPTSRARQELAAETDDADLDVEIEEPVVEGEVEGDEDEELEQALQAPASLSKEAKAEWAKTPKTVQQAFLKREQDTERGVQALKATYGELDKILAPRAQMLQQQGHTPAEAVNQLFLWFDALSMDPTRIKKGEAPVALIALAHSFGIDLATGGLVGDAPQQQQQVTQGDQPNLAALPEEVRNYIAGMEQKVNQLGQMVQGGFQNFQQTFQSQAMEKTTGIMEAWANGKPYFDEVRQQMAVIIGSRMIPPKADGSADLDTAYDMAIYANPTVRERVLVDRRKAALAKRQKAAEAEKAANQAAVDKARRANSGVLRPSSPGATFANDDKRKKGKSVRDSIADAVEELNGR